MSKSDYQKYLKYKKKYLNAKKIYGGGESIKDDRSRLFMKLVNKTYRPEIKPVPEDIYAKPLPAYSGSPDFEVENPEQRRSTRVPNLDTYQNIIKLLKNNNILNLNLQVTPDCKKHSILLYFDKERNTIELWDSNGYCHGPKTWSYLEKLLDYLETNIEEEVEVARVVSNEEHHNINHLGEGHCDALSLFYAILRQEGYERGQDIYTVDWKNSANIKRLNTYIKENKIKELKNFEANEFILN